MTFPGRPTLRCLTKDLEHGWEDVAHLRIVEEGAFHELKTPLHDLAHPVIRHLTEVFTGTDSVEIQRESISGLSNPMWYKLKTGRWRGAVFVDPEGTAWLCAAGLRRGGESTDFYKSFMERIQTSGPTEFLPTADDLQQAKRERITARLNAWERSLHHAGQAAFLESVRSGAPATMPVTSPKDESVIATAAIEVVEIAEADNSLVEVTLEFFDIQWTSAQYVDRAQEVVMLSICNEPTVWQPGHTGERQIFSLQSSAGVPYLVESLRDDSLAGLPAEPQLSHYAKKDHLLGSAVNGEAVATLCGVWLVQSRDAEKLPKCPGCVEIHARLPRPED